MGADGAAKLCALHATAVGAPDEDAAADSPVSDSASTTEVPLAEAAVPDEDSAAELPVSASASTTGVPVEPLAVVAAIKKRKGDPIDQPVESRKSARTPRPPPRFKEISVWEDDSETVRVLTYTCFFFFSSFFYSFRLLNRSCLLGSVLPILQFFSCYFDSTDAGLEGRAAIFTTASSQDQQRS